VPEAEPPLRFPSFFGRNLTDELPVRTRDHDVRVLVDLDVGIDEPGDQEEWAEEQPSAELELDEFSDQAAVVDEAESELLDETEGEEPFAYDSLLSVLMPFDEESEAQYDDAVANDMHNQAGINNALIGKLPN